MSSFMLFSQSERDMYDEPVVIYNKQIYGGFMIHSNGLGGFFNYGTNRGARKILLYSFDFLYMKHEKEIKSYNPVYEDSKSYVIGKVNNMYILRPGIGKKTVLTNKLRKSGVSVGYSWNFGASLGITKPIYLEIGYPSIPYDYLLVERYDPEKHFFDKIYGRASGFNGLNQLSVYPGLFFKFALQFEYANYKDALKGLEVGVAFDGYYKEVPIMAPQFVDKNKQLFTTFFVNIFFGKKYIQR